MSFDKIKAMRNAERFLSQGKIRAAINEYQQVVEHDPKDFSTLNTLGDLYAKNSESKEAVGCFTQVAEYYNIQGFSQKAIAIYNKISRIEPASIEVSAKLAQLYQSKGSIAEARRHYTSLAEHYQSKGQKIEALAIWKQIAELDPHNTETYLKIAESCWQEEQFDEAAHAFTEAGFRFVKQEKFEAAITAFARALETKKNDARALKGLVKAQISLGDAADAADTLETVLKEQPNNREILSLLADCYLEMNETAKAERTTIKLVEQEPGNFPKFLDLVKVYLKSNNTDAATRALSLASEHLIVGGRAEDLLQWANEILARNPEQVDALRLVVRFYSWQRNEDSIKESLQRMAEAANAVGAFEDERYALSQLVLLAPQETHFIKRLQELGTLYGFEPVLPEEYKSNGDNPHNETISQFQTFEIVPPEIVETNGNVAKYDFADVQPSYDFETNGASQNEFESNEQTNATNDFAFYDVPVEEMIPADFQPNDAQFFEQATEQFEETGAPTEEALKPADEHRLHKELESVEFYISQGYHDLAAKTLDELEAQFGRRTELEKVRRQLLDSAAQSAGGVSADEVYETTVENNYAAPEIFTVEPVVEIAPPTIEVAPIQESVSEARKYEDIEELKSEIGFDDEPSEQDESYEMHYHLGTAYKEMGLMEKAIKEFQSAAALVEMNDGTRRFFQCANLLGHCFMEKQMPSLAVMWFERGLQVADLNDEEKHALYYELGNAFEADGDTDKSVNYFERLYAENVEFRDVSQRLHGLHSYSSVS